MGELKKEEEAFALCFHRLHADRAEAEAVDHSVKVLLSADRKDEVNAIICSQGLKRRGKALA